MSSNGRTVIIAVVALIVGAAGGIAFGMMQVDEVTQQLVSASQERDQQQQTADRLRKNNEEAAKKYGRELGKLVNSAPAPAAAAPAAAPADPAAAAAASAPAPEDASKLADAARALLATRDGFRSSIDALRGSMNSEFDALAIELGNPAPDAMKLRQALDSLKQNWPAKEKSMEEATRKLLADLGVLGAASAPAPAAPAAARENK